MFSEHLQGSVSGHSKILENRSQGILSDPGWPSFPNSLSPRDDSCLHSSGGRQALCLLLFVCLGEAPDISLLFHSPLTLRSMAAPWGLCLRFSCDPSLPVTKGCLREQALGWQTSPMPGILAAAALPALGMDRAWLWKLAWGPGRLLGACCVPGSVLFGDGD